MLPYNESRYPGLPCKSLRWVTMRSASLVAQSDAWAASLVPSVNVWEQFS